MEGWNLENLPGPCFRAFWSITKCTFVWHAQQISSFIHAVMQTSSPSYLGHYQWLGGETFSPVPKSDVTQNSMRPPQCHPKAPLSVFELSACRIIPVTPIYKLFWPFGRGTTPVRGLGNHLLITTYKWDEPPSRGSFNSPLLRQNIIHPGPSPRLLAPAEDRLGHTLATWGLPRNTAFMPPAPSAKTTASRSWATRAKIHQLGMCFCLTRKNIGEMN